MKGWASTSEREWQRQLGRLPFAALLPDLRNALGRATEKDRALLHAMVFEIEAQVKKHAIIHGLETQETRSNTPTSP